MLLKVGGSVTRSQVASAKGGVPMSESTDPLKILTTDAQIAGWNNEELPSDRVSTENGVRPGGFKMDPGQGLEPR